MSRFSDDDIKLSQITGFFHPLIYRWNRDNDPKIDKGPYMVIKLSDNFTKNILDYRDTNFIPILHIRSLYFSNSKCMIIIEIIDII